MTARILIADDHKIMREGLRTLLKGESGLEVIAEAKNGREAVKLAKELVPDLVIMDITMPDLNGIEATRRILDQFPSMRILALSMHSDRRFVAEVLSAGASGYLLKDCAFEELSRAIKTVLSGQTYLCPGVSDVVVKDYVATRSEGDSGVFKLLTPREREVLQLMAEGKTTKQIALELHLSAKTIETHRRQLMQKLDLHSTAELTKYAIREGLTSLDD